MNPNKKILNPKNNSPWLLCPSKSFPGKFYYFNGSTGESAWCLSETDKNVKKDTIHRVNDKAHTYPEPFGPPIDESTNTTNSFTSLKNSTEYANVKQPQYLPSPSPLFGQAVFPKYISPDFTPKVFWALTPMYIPGQSQAHRPMLDQITQTYQPEQSTFAQTSSVPLNQFQTKRTLNLTPEGFRYNQNQFMMPFEKPMFDQTPSNFSAFKSKEAPIFGAKPQMKDEACQTFRPIRPRLRTQSESDSTPKSVLKPSRSVENLCALFTKDVETSTLNPPHKVDDDKLNELDKNDLRFLLVAKRKVVSKETFKTDEDQSKPLKTQERESSTPKKRVTFDLQAPGDTSSEDIPDIDQSPGSSQGERLATPSAGRVWYLATDTEVLLSDLQYIEQLVKSDGRCRLLAPRSVAEARAARGRGPAGSLPARRLLRTLASWADRVLVQSKPEYEAASPEEDILQCCWNLLQENHHVVLITNNKKLLNEAKHIDLECYTIDEIKDGGQYLLVPQTDMEKGKIIVNNENRKSENLFMQNLSEINSFSFPKTNEFVHESKINLFGPDTTVDKALCKRDANDKFRNITKINNMNMMLDSEMKNLRDQIEHFGIVENSAIRNRTKLIMENVSRSAENDPKIVQNTRNTKEKDYIKDKLNDTNNFYTKNQGLRSVQNNFEIVDEMDQDIRKLNVRGNNVERVNDTIKVSGITKLNDVFNLDEDLERFNVKNAVVENRVKSRLDEWFCRLNQIMEGVLTDVLLKENAKMKGMVPPWSLFEAIQVLGETFKKQQNIKLIIERFSIKLLNSSSNNGKLIKNMKPNDFLKLVGFSMMLIQQLREILNYKELYEASDMISELLKNIEDPNTDIDLSLEKVNTPILSRSEIQDTKIPVTFRKSQNDVIDYLKKHFAAWKTYEDNPEERTLINDKTGAVQDKEPNIVRTFGKNLNMLKINNSKAITVENNETKENVNNEPKVIRNIKIIDAFEEKLKKSEKFDLDVLDYDESMVTVSSDDENLDDASNKMETIKLDEVANVKTNDLAEYNTILDDLSVSESSDVDTECIRAYPLAKIFLVRLKNTFILIYKFINQSMQEYQNGMTLDKKKDVQFKTEITHQYVLKMIERLKSIIARESGNGTTLKDLLVRAGDYVDDDNIMTNYKEIVAKYLKQAGILEEALKIVLSLSNSSPKDRALRYCGTFNSYSPVLPTRALRSNKML